MPSSHDSTPAKPTLRRDRGLSPIWIIPALTLILAGWYLTHSIQQAGQRIEILFQDAQGLEAGRTVIRYQGLEVGIVREVTLGDDLGRIFVEADIFPNGEKLLGSDTQFWLVKPSASLSGVTGLDALVAGNYIAVLPATDGELPPNVSYTALPKPPATSIVPDGLPLKLLAKDLGSLSVGSKVVFKKIPVGEVYNFALDKERKMVEIDLVIYPAYQDLVNTNSRFWNVSGVRSRIGLDGVDIQLESLSAIIQGAIAIDTADEGDAVEKDHEFTLYPDLAAAGRGIAVTIDLPSNHGLSASGSKLLFKGVEVGRVSAISLSTDREKASATATLEPMFADLLTTGAQFVIEEATVSLTKVENLTNLITGNHISIIEGQGKTTREFTALWRHEFDVSANRAKLITLTADQSFGIERDTPVLYKGLQVGSVVAVSLVNDRVEITILLGSEYASLIRSGNRFFVDGNIRAQFDQGGLTVTTPSVDQLLNGAISFTKQGSATDKQRFTLYPNQQLAELAHYGAVGFSKLELLSDTLPSASKGSPLLYRNLTVGKVNGHKLTQQGMVTEVLIENRYKHLITDNVVFWDHSGLKVDASLAGINLSAAPLTKLIQGAIAFDVADDITNKNGRYYRLFDSFDDAKNSGMLITLTSTIQNSITVGTPIQYQSIQVGEIVNMVADFEANVVKYQARLFPTFQDDLATKGTYYRVREAEIGLEGVKNLSASLITVIDVLPSEPGLNKAQLQTEFSLDIDPDEGQFTEFVLQSPQRSSVSAGTPVRFRNIQVGQVSEVTLGSLADRVFVTVEIESEYAHLVRENTYFWNESGVDVSFGLTGASIKSGTLDSILSGGIAFATPNEALQPIAKSNRSFVLHEQADEEWLEWRTPIPRP